MLDPGGGGGYGGTNWANASMVDMWMTLQNQDTTPHWQLVDGWRKSYELTLQHMSAVRNYRENLATAWPPGKSPAAAAYVARLDELLGHLQETYDAAIANHSALSSATLSISSTRTELERVVTEYLANESKLVDYEHAKEVAAMPVGGKGAMPRPTPRNPVPTGRQAELETRARGLMSSLSIDLIEAKSQLRQPKPYDPSKSVSDDKEIRNGSEYSAPPLPPVVPFDPDTGAQSSPSHLARPSQQFPASVGSVTPTAPGHPGLVLGGNQPPLVGPQPQSPIVTPSPGLPGPTIGAVPGLPGAPIRPIGKAPAGPGPIGGAQGGVSSGLSRAAPAGPRGAIPPGGVIGAPQGPVSRTAPQRVNPVGGVIGQSAGNSVMPMGSPNSADDNSGSQGRRWDPDNPWATAEGVPPVLMPSKEQPVDPGPAIGLD
ncbi:hypothetical protein AB0M54_02480 [Actinoplanes sp. NPDC051470]|uniref:hypothetical protein n=1 Tax=Actinoplanes sp. NPDC051470 TaxID=3157224 RepID=UPI0034237E21